MWPASLLSDEVERDVDDDAVLSEIAADSVLTSAVTATIVRDLERATSAL